MPWDFAHILIFQKQGIVWTGFALCVAVFSGRLAIRITCFHRFFVEDYLMLLSLSMLLATMIIASLRLQYIYNMVDVGNGAAPSANFMDETTKGLRGFGVLMLLNYLGIWLIKFNFLLFFRRLGNHVPKYRYAWWMVVLFNIAAGATVIGLVDFPCLMSSSEYILVHCSTLEKTKSSYTAAKISCSLDAVSDALSAFELPPPPSTDKDTC